jgi:hypothetical protein
VALFRSILNPFKLNLEPFNERTLREEYTENSFGVSNELSLKAA